MTKILMVCLGNICRSPLAEGILRTKILNRKLHVFVDSAGTSSYHSGCCPDKRSIQNARSHHIDISKLVARQFTVKDFDQFDKIYVMDSSNYADILALARNENDRKKVEMILNVIYPDSNKSVPDPYFGGEEGFEKVFALLDSACEIIADQLQKTAVNDKQ